MKSKNKTFGARLSAGILVVAMLAAALSGCNRELTEQQSAALIALQNTVTYYEDSNSLSHWEDLVALAAANQVDGIGINWNALTLPETPTAPILPIAESQETEEPAETQDSLLTDSLSPQDEDTGTEGTEGSGEEQVPSGDPQQTPWTPVDVSAYPGAVITSILKGEDYDALAASLASAQNPENGAFSEVYINQHIWSMITLTAAVGDDGYDYDKAAAYLLTFQREDGGFGYAPDASDSDVDLTGIASIALAPYYEKNKRSTEMKALVSFYKEKQTETGGYSGFGGENAATIASAIWGLSALDQPLPQTEDGLSPMDALLSFQNEDGSFRTQKDGDHTADPLSTRQAAIALCDVVNDVNTYVLLAEDAESYRIENISGPAITLNIEFPRGSDLSDVSTPFTVEEGNTAFDALILYGKIKEIPVVFSGKDSSAYVQSINGIAEKEYGDASGWIFSVNGETPQQSAGSVILQQGDVLTWTYVTDIFSVPTESGITSQPQME